MSHAGMVAGIIAATPAPHATCKQIAINCAAIGVAKWMSGKTMPPNVICHMTLLSSLHYIFIHTLLSLLLANI